MNDLDRRIEELAKTPRLLVASDYDGTLAPIVSDPARAFPSRETIVALRGMATLPDTHVSVISGRSLRDLASLAGFPDSIHLVGSHGSEFDADFLGSLAPHLEQLRRSIALELQEIAEPVPGLSLEEKPSGVAFHYRNADPGAAERAVQAVLEGPAAHPGIHLRHGKKVVELSVLGTNKGDALDRLRSRLGVTAVLFLGDDVTDEDGFGRLRGPDVGVKVGEGDSSASYRVADPSEVARTIAKLYELRCAWLRGTEAVPIEEHALLSDHRAMALMTPRARLVWMCLPRVDSASVFAELVGGPSAGYFEIGPAEGREDVRQHYCADTLVLETSWGGVHLTDFFDTCDGRPRQRAGRSDLLRVVDGCGRVRVEFAPRLDYGRVPTRLQVHEHGLVVGDCLDPIVLRSPKVDWQLREDGIHQTAWAEFDLDGGRVVFDLRYGTASLGDTRASATERRDGTEDYWSRWAAHLTLPDLARDLVLRSALTLKALCYSPSGAILAAATTSLPETLGGNRNWDYRYAWLRDAALSAGALVKLGSNGEAISLLDWILGIVDRLDSPAQLQPLYSVTGGEVHTDTEIPELSGYRQSRPVRIGNTAARQVQLDVFGPVVDLIYQLMEREAPLSSEHVRLVEAMVRAVRERWHEPDHGIWELRLPRRHHLHSKVMCWMTLDRAVRILRDMRGRVNPEWETLRDEIREEVLSRGWSESTQSFTADYDSQELDAAVLHIGLSGLIAPDDPRFVKTVNAIERELRSGPTVYRYHYDDGLPGQEGGFHLCTSWLIDALWLAGRRDEARALFGRLIQLTGSTGLMSEEYDPQTEIALGNHPQAYSHVGIIENALRLSSAD